MDATSNRHIGTVDKLSRVSRLLDNFHYLTIIYEIESILWAFGH